MEFIIAKNNLYNCEKYSDYLHVFWSPIDLKKNHNLKYFQLYSFVEEQKDLLKSEIVTLVSALSSIRVNENYMHNFLSPDGNFSYLYLTEFFEKDLYLSNNNLLDLIKLLAFKKICNRSKKKFIIYGCPNHFESSLVEFIELNDSYPKKILKKKRYIKNPFLQISSLSLLLVRFNLLFIRSLVIKLLINLLSFKRKSIKYSQVIFFNYFLRIKDNKMFESGYWNNLPVLLDNRKKCISWVHIYVKTKKIKSIFKLLFEIIKFNNLSNSQFNHYLLDEFCSLNSYLRASRDIVFLFFKLNRELLFEISSNEKIMPIIISFLIKDIRSLFMHKRGVDVIHKNFQLRDINQNLRQGTKIFYLAESKFWERSLCFYSNFNSDKKTYAYNHATIRYWDTRYSFSINNVDKLSRKYFPSYLLFTSKKQKSNCIIKEYSEKNIKFVEATRYMHLREENKVKKNFMHNKKILVVGDASFNSTSRLVSIINNIDKDLAISKFIFRSHPYAIFKKSDFLIDIEIDQSEDIYNSLSNSSFIITTHLTSASFDSKYLKIPVLIMNHESGLNLSPLKSDDYLEFSSPNQLSKIIKIMMKEFKSKNNNFLSKSSDDLIINGSFERWITLIS